MKILFLVTLFIIPQITYGWYCEEVASEWMQRGKMLQTCGIGYGKNETIARENAFENAQKEFDKICNIQSNCGSKAYNIDPMRTVCNPKGGGFTCHRLVNFYISDKERRKIQKEKDIKSTQPIINKTEVHNHYKNEYNQKFENTIHVHKNIIENATVVEPSKFTSYVRSVGGISIYETNDASQMGMHLYNPSDREIDLAIKRSSHGGLNRIYIHRN